MAGELNDLSYLVKHGASSWHGCWRPRARRRKPTAARQLEDESRGRRAVVEAGVSTPAANAGRAAHQPAHFPSSDQSRRRDAMINYRLALILDPENAHALNNLAWSLVKCSGRPLVRPGQGLALARKAVALEPNEWAS